MAHPQIAAFPRLAKENTKPARLLAGQKTLMSRTIQGPHTELGGSSRLELDSVNGEIYVPEGRRILVFPRDANGDVAPIRILTGPDTRIRNAGGVAVDPVHNLMVVGTQLRGDGVSAGSLLIFNRTDNGNVKPRAVIQGPNSGLVRALQMQIYPAKGWIVVAQAGAGDEMEPEDVFVGVWSIFDNGDIPPRWKLGGPKSLLKKPRGVALNPKHNEIYVADMRLNEVLTFYFPEMF